MTAHYIDQEAEHHAHEAGAASELQNCYAEARAKLAQLNAADAQKIQDALDAKLFVLVERSPYYCRATDAFAGTYTRLVAIGVSRFDLVTHLKRHYPEADQDNESEFEILPALPRRAPRPPANEKDIPF